MLSITFTCCIMACLALDTMSAAEPGIPLLLTQQRIAQYKRREACAWFTSVGLGLATFATGVVLTTPVSKGIIPEREEGEKLAWCCFGVSSACLFYNCYKSMAVCNKDIINVMRAKSNYVVRHIGSISVAGISLGAVVGFMGNQLLMGNILMGAGLLGAACDSAMSYAHYWDLNAKLAEFPNTEENEEL